jgi:DNA-binding transcriptional LysR family regulator
MNLAEIEAFLALADDLHFGRTAERLYISQSRVSRLVAGLERELGGLLFERTTRSVGLTPLGIQFRDRIQPTYVEMQAAFDLARRSANEVAGDLRVGFTSTTEGPVLNGLIAAFEAMHRDCKLTLFEVSDDACNEKLRNDEIDVLVNWLALDDPDLDTLPIVWEDRVLAVASGHPLATSLSVSIEDLAHLEVMQPEPPLPALILDAFIPPVTPTGKRIVRAHCARTVGEMWAMVARGQIVHPTVASMSMHLNSRDDIVLVPIRDLPPIPLGLVWKTACETARIRALVKTADSFIREPVGSHPICK